MKSLLRLLALSTLLAFFAAPLAATHGEITVTRSPGGPVVAGSIISVTVNIENTSQFGEDLFDASVNTAFTDPNLVLIPGSVTTRYVEINNPSGTIVSGNAPGDRDVVVEFDPVPPNWTAQVEFRMRLASVVAAGVDEAFTQIFLTYCHNNCQSIPWYMIVPVVARPELEVNKNDFGASVIPGGAVQYNISVTNIGNQEATGLTLTDTIPGRTRFYAAASDPAWSCSPNGFSGSVCTITFDSLWPGDTEAFAFALQADSPPVPAGWNIFRNTARASDDGSNSGDVPRTALDNEYTPLVAQPDLSLAISDGGVAASPGDTVPYTLSYSNVGNQDATGVLLETTVPSSTRFASTSSTPGWTCSPSAGGPGATCTLVVGDLAVGATAAAAFSLTIDSPVPSGLTQVAHAVTVRDDGTNGADPNPSDNQAVETTPVAAAPDLTLTKGDGGATARPGDVVTYTLNVRNAGDQAADGVRLQETVPAQSTFESAASAGGWTCSPSSGSAGSTCTLAIGSLPAGGSASRAFAVRVASELFSGVDELSNTATVADDGANGADPTPGNNSASDTTPLLATPDLTLTKDDGGASVAAGELVTYSLTIRNVGVQSAVGVVLEETVPDHASYEPAPGAAGWTCTPASGPAGATCTIPIGSIGAGASRSRSFAVRVDEEVPSGVDQLLNTATVRDDGTNGAEPTPADNTATDTTPLLAAPDLTLAKDDAGATARPGQVLTYTLSYQNVGDQEAANVILQETVPFHTTFFPDQSSPGWTCTPSAGDPGAACTLALGDIPAGARESATFAVLPAASFTANVDQLLNVAAIDDDASNGLDPTPDNNRATERTPLDAAPDLTVSKSDGGASARPGELVTYTLTYSNEGSQTATGTFLREFLPLYTSISPEDSTPGWTCAPPPPVLLTEDGFSATCVLLLGDLAPGDSGSATLALLVDDALPAGVDLLTNTVEIRDDGSNGTDATPEDNEASDSTPLDGAPDLVLGKDDGGAVALAGDLVEYTLAYRNVGAQSATGVELLETVPPHSTFAASASTAGWSCAPAAGGAGATCTLVLGDLTAGASGAATFAVRIADELPAGVDQLLNTAVIADDGLNGSDPTPEDNEATDSTPLDVTPDLELLKDDAGAMATTGELVAYTLTFRNAGGQSATRVELTETVPAHTTFSASESAPGWSCAPGAGGAGATCTLAVGDLAAGTSGAATFAVRVANELPAGVDRVVNTAVVADDGANGADPTPENNEATDSTPFDATPDLVLAKNDGGATAVVGELVAYTLTYRNAGAQSASGVELLETVPAHSTFSASDSTPGWSCAPGAGGAGATCTLTLGNLAAGASSTATFAVRVADELPAGVDQLLNTALIADDGANGPDPTPANNEASDSTPLDGSGPGDDPAEVDLFLSDLLAEDRDDSGTVTAGDVLTYSVEVVNLTQTTLTTPHFAVPIPDYTSYVPESTRGGDGLFPTPTPSTLEVTLPDLPPGERFGFAWDVLLDAEVPDSISELRAQGTVVVESSTPHPSDDPDTPELDDPTLTPLGHDGGPGEPHPIPTVTEYGLLLLALLLAAGAWRRIG